MIAQGQLSKHAHIISTHAESSPETPQKIFLIIPSRLKSWTYLYGCTFS